MVLATVFTFTLTFAQQGYAAEGSKELCKISMDNINDKKANMQKTSEWVVSEVLTFEEISAKLAEACGV